MPKAIRLSRTGGPDVLEWTDVEVGEPGPSQVRVRHTAVGVNFIDTYHRSGLYPLPLPSGLGSEGAGVVEAVGPGVDGVRPGDRVAYAGGPPGSYSEARVMPADRLVRVPDGVPDQQAAAMMLKGMTVQLVWTAVEARRLGMRHPWIGVLGTVLGVFAFTRLRFLRTRERDLRKTRPGTA